MPTKRKLFGATLVELYVYNRGFDILVEQACYILLVYLQYIDGKDKKISMILRF